MTDPVNVRIASDGHPIGIRGALQTVGIRRYPSDVSREERSEILMARMPGVAHVHPCPECYEHERCFMDCTVEGDLGIYRGLPTGHHVACSKCVALAEREQEKRA